jgi:hypothetical protein
MRHTTGSVYAVFEKPVHMYRGTTMAGIIRDEAANNDPKRGFVGGYEMETLSLGLPFMAAFLNPGGWGRPSPRAMDSYANMAGLWMVGEDMPQETNRRDAASEGQGQVRHAGRRMCISTITRTTSRCATTPTSRAPALYEAVGATRRLPDAALSLDAQSRHQPDEREAARRRRQQMARRTTSRTCSCRTAASSPRARRKIRR